MNSWDLGDTVSCSSYLLVMVSWPLGIPDPEMCTCGILGTLGCGTFRTLDPEIYTWHGTLGTQDPGMYT